MPPTLASLADDLAAGRTTSRHLVDDALARIADGDGEGATCFTLVDADGARGTCPPLSLARFPAPGARVEARNLREPFEVRA